MHVRFNFIALNLLLKLHYQYFRFLILELIIIIFIIILLFFIPFVFAFAMLILLSISILPTTIFNFEYDYTNQITLKFIGTIIVIHPQCSRSLHNSNSINYPLHFKLTMVLVYSCHHLFIH